MVEQDDGQEFERGRRSLSHRGTRRSADARGSRYRIGRAPSALYRAPLTPAPLRRRMCLREIDRRCRSSSLARAGGVLAERLAPNPKGGLCAASACSGQGECSHCRGGGVLAVTSAVAGCGLRWIDGVAWISRVMVLAAPRTIAPVDPTAIKQRVGGVFPNVRRPGWTATALPSRSSGSRTCASCCACAVARIARGPAMPDLPAERRGSGLLLRPRKEIRVSGPAARVWPCDGRLAVRRERRRGVRR